MSSEEKKSIIATIEQFYFDNRKQINIASIAVIVLIGGWIAYSKYWQPKREAEAQSQIFVAQRFFAQDSLDKALNGDGNYLGMVDIADQYPRTKAGNLAKFYAGRIYLGKGEFQTALDYFKKVSFKDEIMAAQVQGLIGDCEIELGNNEDGADAYFKAGKMRDNEFTSAYNLKKAGMAYEMAGDYKSALKAYLIIKDKYKESAMGYNIDKYITKCETKLGK